MKYRGESNVIKEYPSSILQQRTGRRNHQHQPDKKLRAAAADSRKTEGAPRSHMPEACSSHAELLVDFLYPTDCPAVQPHFDAMRMRGRFCEDILHNAVGQPAGTLILFQHDGNTLAWFYIVTPCSLHMHLEKKLKERIGYPCPQQRSGSNFRRGMHAGEDTASRHQKGQYKSSE